MITILEKLGLTEKEAKVYLATLELAQDTVQNIAKKAGVNRPTAYFILEKLMKMGLVSTLEQGKKTLFIAESPRELEHILDKEIKEIEDAKTELKDTMNQLMAIYNVREGKPVVKYFEGADGLEAMDRYGHNLLKRNEEILGIAPIDVLEKYFPKRREDSLKERIKQGVKSRTIYTHEKGEFATAKNKTELREGIMIPRQKFPFNATIAIYPQWGIKLFYFDPVNPFGVVIESKELAYNLKLFFELAWEGAKSFRRAQK